MICVIRLCYISLRLKRKQVKVHCSIVQLQIGTVSKVYKGFNLSKEV